MFKSLSLYWLSYWLIYPPKIKQESFSLKINDKPYELISLFTFNCFIKFISPKWIDLTKRVFKPKIPVSLFLNWVANINVISWWVLLLTFK